MSNTLRNRFPNFSAILEARGFKLMEESGDAEGAGDALVVVESGDLRMRFIRDRSQVFVDVAPSRSPGDWIQLEYALEYLGRSTLERTGQPTQLGELADLLGSNYEQLCRLFSHDQYRANMAKLNEFREKRHRELRPPSGINVDGNAAVIRPRSE